MCHRYKNHQSVFKNSKSHSNESKLLNNFLAGNGKNFQFCQLLSVFFLVKKFKKSFEEIQNSQRFFA